MSKGVAATATSGACSRRSFAIPAKSPRHAYRTYPGMIDYIPQPPVEARTWLRTNANPGALATNRFGRTERALAFVDALYARGATEVLVDDPRVMD